MTDSIQGQWAGYQCPKCGYQRAATESASIHECPSCGVVYAKVKLRAEAVAEEGKKGSPLISWAKAHPKHVMLAALIVVFIPVQIRMLTDPNAITKPDNQAVHAQRERDSAAMHLCEAQAKASAANPGTVDVQWFQGVFAEPYNEGTTLVRMNFTAKNAFGAELPFRINCLVSSDGELVSHNIMKR